MSGYDDENKMHKAVSIKKNKMLMAYCEAFGNGVNVLLSKQLIKCDHILRTSKQASIGDVPFRSSAAKAIANKPQLHPSFCF